MSRLVIDASALAEFLLRTPTGRALDASVARPRAELHTPALCDIEIASLLRRWLLRDRLTVDRAGDVLEDLFDLPLTRHGHQLLLPRVVQLRENFTAYDAAYVALAERLEAGLVTGDRRLARAVRAHLSIPVIEGR